MLPKQFLNWIRVFEMRWMFLALVSVRPSKSPLNITFRLLCPGFFNDRVWHLKMFLRLFHVHDMIRIYVSACCRMIEDWFLTQMLSFSFRNYMCNMFEMLRKGCCGFGLTSNKYEDTERLKPSRKRSKLVFPLFILMFTSSSFQHYLCSSW